MQPIAEDVETADVSVPSPDEWCEMKWSDFPFVLMLLAICLIMYGLTVLAIRPMEYRWTQPPDNMCNVWEH